MQAAFHLRDELFRAAAEDEGARLGGGAAFEEIEALAADLALFEFRAGAEVLRLDVGAGGGDAAACGLDDTFEVVGRDAAGAENVTVGEVPVDVAMWLGLAVCHLRDGGNSLCS